MSDNLDPPAPEDPVSAGEPSDAGSRPENEGPGAGATPSRRGNRRNWLFLRRRRGDGDTVTVASEKVQFWAGQSVVIMTTAIVAGTAMYATLKTSSDGRLEDRRGARVDALVEHWSSTIADASTAVELLGQRSNDLWAYGTALHDQGVVLDEALTNEKNREKDYLSVRKSLASTTARAGLVSSISTTDCLDKFIGLIDTWQNALNWTRSSLQVEDGLEGAVAAVNMQLEHRESLNDAITIVRRLARTELAKAGEANMKCNLPDVDEVWAQLVPTESSSSSSSTSSSDSSSSSSSSSSSLSD